MNTDAPTVGVEEEFLLVDGNTGTPVARNLEVARAATEIGIELQLELSSCQVEASTGVHTEAAALLRELRELRRTIADCAEKNSARLLAVALPPTVPPLLPITETPRYRRIADRFGVLAQETALCGCHVHIAIPNRATAIEVSNFLRPRLPLFLALTANSAIHRDAETGYASWRSVQWRRWPSAGPPPHFMSVEHYEATVRTMQAAGIILDPQMVYWDVRPSVTYPTVEIRISDVPATVEETVLLATLIRASVMTALTHLAEGRSAPIVAPELLHAAYWRAAHTGLTADLLDPLDARVAPARVLLGELVDEIAPALDRLGESERVNRSLTTVFAHGNGAIRQVRAFRRRHRTEDVIAAMAEATLLDCR
ncbi:glutamate--cysteine ligase [Nocardia sp. CDC159]|uniref:Putative glutamate--cysteine ligase 2 n=1 Tax=Nocardia pulmonis TaxID=2951408 RepID=A0A9X2E3B0_9NOCA|nr:MULTISPECIES: glutamate--cysteine ligase [Nocardia]MCM6772323.1 glutamate--cysteine ligase [Nocardia pulmonis]MCM6785019.1 glutamate--cysteine ligase [Nocardia sp. CDC159]